MSYTYTPGEVAASRRPGFTLIELLVVLVVVAVLATIMIVRMNGVTRRANLAVLQSDLRSVTVAQEIHRERNLEYVALEDLSGIRASAGVALELGWVDTDGYALTGTHSGLPGVLCGVYRGPAPDGAAGPADTEGVIACQ